MASGAVCTFVMHHRPANIVLTTPRRSPDPADLQSSPVFSTIGSRGYFFFLLFQQFTVDAVDGTIRGAPHPNRALILGADGPWIPYPSHSLLAYLGPKVYMLLLDCRYARTCSAPRTIVIRTDIR